MNEAREQYLKRIVNGSSALKRISREFFKTLKKELPEEALNYECIEFVIKEIKTQIKSKKINL